MMEAYPGDNICFAPACPTISGGEGDNEKIDTREAVDRYNHGPVRLHEGLSPDAMRIVACRQCCSPVQSGGSGGAHLNQVAQRVVVKLGVAVAVERAADRIIADGTVVVVKMTIIIHHDGIAPRQSPIGRAADKHINRPCRVHYAKPGDQPDPIFGVKSNRGVTGTGIDAWRCCEDCARRQEATGKLLTPIGGGGETDVGGSAIEKAAHLEGRNDGGARGKGIRFDFCLVLTRGVGIRVATEWEK